MAQESEDSCPTVTTICGGKTFEAPSSVFFLAPVLRDCIAFCEEDSGFVDLDPLFFKPRGVDDHEAAAVFQVNIGRLTCESKNNNFV
jgi:hypothetical protein